MENTEQISIDSVLKKNDKAKPQIIVVDDFYHDPMAVRDYAMKQTFLEDIRYHKGKRTKTAFIPSWVKSEFSSLLKMEVSEFVGATGVFQYCIAQDSVVYHFDEQQYAAMVYLTPNAPVDTGTCTYKSKITGLRQRASPEDCKKYNKSENELNFYSFNGNNFYDRNNMELVDSIGNIFNRLVIFDAHLIHSATSYFGNSIQNGRLFHLYFFNCK
jgi:hypothetical protein